jgi:TnpA family transposase
VVLDSTHPDPQVREKVYQQIAQDALAQACALVGELARPAKEEQQYQQLLGKYATVRTFLPTLLRTVTFWDDMLRVAGSLKLGTVHATDLMRALQRGGHPSALARAIGEVGRDV